MSLIVLEGCDGVGKTTIAKNLAAMTGASIVHCTKNTANDYNFFYQMIRTSTKRDIIADRFMYGQFVYQELRDRKLTRAFLNQLEMELLEVGGKVFYVTTADGIIADRLKARDEKIINGLSPMEVDKRFRSVFLTQSLIRVKELWVDPYGGYKISDMTKGV